MGMVAKRGAKERGRKPCLRNKVIDFAVSDDQSVKGKVQEKVLEYQDL